MPAQHQDPGLHARARMTGVPTLPDDLDLLALQQSDPARFPLLLESVADGNASSRWDLLLLTDGSGIELQADGVTRTLDGQALGGRFLDCLDAEVAAARATAMSASTGDDDAALPFRGGWALYLSYELAGQVEPVLHLPPAPGPLPVALALRCPAAILRDRRDGRLRIVCEPGREDLLACLGRSTASEPASRSRA